MRVTFVYPNITGDFNYKGYAYLGIGYLASILKEAGHTVSLLQILNSVEDAEFFASIKKGNPQIVAFTATTNMYPFVQRWAKLLKNNMSVLTICGGPHPTLDPESVINDEGIDIVCIGEGEGALLDLCNLLEQKNDISQIENLWIKKDNTVIKNKVRPLIEDLDSLPFPDRDIFNYSQMQEASEGQFRILASRGCPFNCFNCSNHQLKEVYPNRHKYVRFRSPENIISELQEALSKYKGITYFHFIDDILPMKAQWFGEFSNLYKREIGLPYLCHIHPNLLTEETLKMLKHSNCFQVQIGVESGNDYIREKVLNRPISRQQIIKGFKLCKQYGLTTYAYNMVGMPFEDKDKILDTVKLNAKFEPAIIHTSIYYPYPKTKLFDICKENGFLTDRRIDNYFSDTCLNFDKSLRNFIIFIQRFFHPLVKIFATVLKLPKALCPFVENAISGMLKLNIVAWAINTLRFNYIQIRNRLNKGKIVAQKKIVYSPNLEV